MVASRQRILELTIVLAWLAAGCTSPMKINVGGTCILNSDCNQGLVCTWGKCHDACHTSADCPAGGVCVTSSDQSNVCQLPGEMYCIYNHDCPTGLICGVDQKCRKQCQVDIDCLYGEICTSEQICVDLNSAPIVRDGGAGGTGGAPGTAGTSGSHVIDSDASQDVPGSAAGVSSTGGAGSAGGVSGTAGAGSEPLPCPGIGCMGSGGAGGIASAGAIAGAGGTGVIASGTDASAVDGGGGVGGTYQCDDAGNCQCLTIASLGKVAHYGNQSGTGDNTDAFQLYMNTQTKGTATMAMFGNVVGSPRNFTLTADFLKKYDVVILQALEDSEYTGFWTFTSDEVSALSDWVNKGGGLITMSGYGSQSQEVDPVNQLLAPFGISYQPSPDIFVQSDCTDNMCYCADGSIPFGGWNASDSPLVDNLNSTDRQVGVSMGRPITCADCQVMGTWQTNTFVGVHKQVGAGRVLAWADEWVTYTSQWAGDPLYIGKDQCAPRTADKIYAIPQFWYNVFRWVAGDGSGCFQMADTTVIQR